MHSTPLNRIIAMTYPGGCFGMRNLPFGYGQVGLGQGKNGAIAPDSSSRDTLIFLRPHDVLIRLEANSSTTPATVKRLVHLGREIQVELLLPQQHLLTAYLSRDAYDELGLRPGHARRLWTLLACQNHAAAAHCAAFTQSICAQRGNSCHLPFASNVNKKRRRNFVNV